MSVALALTLSVEREDGIPVAEDGLFGVISECFNANKFPDDILLTLL